MRGNKNICKYNLIRMLQFPTFLRGFTFSRNTHHICPAGQSPENKDKFLRIKWKHFFSSALSPFTQ